MPRLIDVPIDRLKNVEAKLKRTPNDAGLHYLRGRLNSLAFVTQRATAPVVAKSAKSGATPHLDPFLWIYRPLPAQMPLTAERARRLATAVSEYRIAARLNPRNRMFQMGLGWALETAAPNAQACLREPSVRVAAEAITAYRAAIRLSLHQEKATFDYLPLVTIEASEGAIRLAKKYPSLSAPGLVAEMRENIRGMNANRRGITPIIFPLHGERALAELVDPNARTYFDLAGDGAGTAWPWLKRKTGILVWDPLQTGKIISGRQLFGSVTWWMFFDNGYKALASLDANGDAWLTGEELRGIRLWIDANGNASSDSGEVRELSDMGIVGIGTEVQSQSEGGPSTSQGILWKDGRITPTFDWVARPVTGGRPLPKENRHPVP